MNSEIEIFDLSRNSNTVFVDFSVYDGDTHIKDEPNYTVKVNELKEYVISNSLNVVIDNYTGEETKMDVVTMLQDKQELRRAVALFLNDNYKVEIYA